ncbi:hypothetical protein JYU14_05475, partial [Simkania negevensis]|nr:hypothetical protein [Simkania negevensis]
GGVITTSDMRIQAEKIRYINTTAEGIPITTVEAEENLMLNYQGYTFIGEHINYNFTTKSGVLYKGRVAVPPWYIGGETINILPDGSFEILDAYITTCPSCNDNWRITAKRILLTENSSIYAYNVQFRYLTIPFFWMPTYITQLDSLKDTPISGQLHWGGSKGTRIGVRYRIFSEEKWKSFLSLDYLLKRGLGGGIDLQYEEKASGASLYSKNFFAYDKSQEAFDKKRRFRFMGRYNDIFFDDNITIALQYDRLSDPDMTSDYTIDDFTLPNPEVTELTARTQQKDWLALLHTRVRINPFQSVDQKLPITTLHIRPFAIADSRVVSTNTFTAGYLDYLFSKDLPPSFQPFHSVRASTSNSLYCPISISHFTLTPLIRFDGIIYENSPDRNAATLLQGTVGFDLNTNLYRMIGPSKKHIVEPYIEYRHSTTPSSLNSEHFIFSLNDGFAELSSLRIGVRNDLYTKKGDTIHRTLYLDLYSYAFSHAPSISKHIPRAYADASWHATERLTYYTSLVWNFNDDLVDLLKIGTDYTYSENLALGFEYRHRSKYYWRKSNYNNFVLDATRSRNELLNSPLSDNNNTLLTRLFYRFNPKWNILVESRQGWRRPQERSYFESKATVTTILKCYWQVQMTAEHTRRDNRFSLSVLLSELMPKLRRFQG